MEGVDHFQFHPGGSLSGLALLQEGAVGSDAAEGEAGGRQSRAAVNIGLQFAQLVGDFQVQLSSTSHQQMSWAWRVPDLRSHCGN